ncbi:uncharacterized protein [Diadema antillarum]|uniref:uncharacterized protein n=1 Tax=Diadema antillarum TaxID=105358 RepID=UPI003A8A04FB
MTSPMTAVSMGNQRYFDVYLDDPSSTDEDEYIENALSRPLMSPRRYGRRHLHLPSPMSTATPDTKLPKRRSVWYYKRKKDCLQAFYIIMVIMVIIIFGLVLVRILKDAAQHRQENNDSSDDSSRLSTFSFGGLVLGQTFPVVKLYPTTVPPLYPVPTESRPRPPVHESANKPDSFGEADGAVPNQQPVDIGDSQRTVLPCSRYTVQEVWVENLPQLMTEAGLRLLDVNGDDIQDVIIGFATDVNAYFADEYLLCAIYFGDQRPCFGGALALDGITGEELWRHYTSSEVFALNCNADVTGDKVNDCAISGRAGVMEMINGATGEGLWKYTPSGPNEAVSNFYTAQVIHDIDGDGVRDLLNMQGGDPVRKPGGKVRYSGKLMLLSGADGHVITLSPVPDGMESYYSPQIYYQQGGNGMVLFGTGGETIGGALWVLPLEDLIDNNMEKAQVIYSDPMKGVMVPPILIDLTGDGVMDIVMAMFNSVIVAINGQTFDQLWNHTIPSSESYSTPAPAYYNDDDVPDFMVVYNYGPGYPLYYYAQVTILDGRNGQPLLQKSIISSGSVTTSPITLSMEGHGNDAFLYWRLDCRGHEGDTAAFQFADDDDGVGALSRTDFCRQRFNAETFSVANVLNQHMDVPGQEIYNSSENFEDSHRYTVNATALAMKYLAKYPSVVDLVLQAQSAGEDSSPEQRLEEAEDDLGSSPTMAAPRTIPTTRSYPTEYDKVMHKLSQLISDFNDESNVDGTDAEDVPTDKNTKWSSRQKPDLPGDTPTISSPSGSGTDASKGGNRGNDEVVPTITPPLAMTGDKSKVVTSASEVDPILNGDLTDRLKNLGFPDSWLYPAEEEDTEDDGVKGQHGRRQNNENFDKLSDEDINALLGLLLTGKQAEKGSDTKRHTKRSVATLREAMSKVRLTGQRSRRHAGLHDAGGIQRVISTGTLAPTLPEILDGLPSTPNSIDVIFATYWFYPKPHKLITEEEQKCLDSWMENEEQRMDPSNEFYGLDHDAYENVASQYCSKQAKDAPTPSPKEINPLNLYPFNLDAGEMTVYRLRLSCDCGLEEARQTNPAARCSRILPYEQQQWGAYMGTYGNSYFGPREARRHR